MQIKKATNKDSRYDIDNKYIIYLGLYSPIILYSDMTNTGSQIYAILWKNMLINIRTKQYLRENIIVIAIGVLLVLTQLTFVKGVLTPFFLSLTIFGYSRTVGVSWVIEKNTRQRELQKIMGISPFSYYCGWIFYYILNGLLVSFIIMIILFIGIEISQVQFRGGYSIVHAIIMYVVFMVNITFFILMISSLFSNAKNAAQGIIFIQLFIDFLSFFVYIGDMRTNFAVTFLTGLFPQLSFIFGMSAIGFVPLDFVYTYQQGLATLLVECVIFFFLAIYLDMVMPNEFGSNKKPLFFLDCLKRSNNQIEESQSLLEDSQQIDDQMETSATYEQKKKKDYPMFINLKGVTKRFGNKDVISNFTLNYYGNEIFCLLGHNGAGKSTIVNLLTGLYQPEKGQITLLNKNFSQNMNQIRRNIGVCLQFDVIYDQLTVKEHLQFYCYAKCLPQAQIQAQVNKVIQQCNLELQKDKFGKNLSGGNKRKLSLANALIGKSKLIFLDEPSSSVDPVSRRMIWDILKKTRSPDRFILLTTHHLEEAEQLSQRIGILSYGRLIIVGDCDFIKKTFNTGYHITLDFSQQKDEIAKQKARKIFKTIIKGARQNEQTAHNTLKYIVPEQQFLKLPQLFVEIQKICHVSLKTTTLEDSFVKIGEIEMEEGILEEIAQMSLPEVQCRYNFHRQFNAVFLRKMLTAKKSSMGVISILLPSILIAVGTVLITVELDYDSPSEHSDQIMFYGILISWTIMLLCSNFCGDLVLERQKKIQYLSYVMGLKKLPYWCANYAFDFLNLFLSYVVFLTIVLIIGNPQFKTRLGYLTFGLLLFTFSFISYSYLMSYMFKKSTTAFRTFPFFNLVFFYILPLIMTNVTDSFYASSVSFVFSPFVVLQVLFMMKEVNPFISSQSESSVWYFYLILLCQGFVYLGCFLAIQNLRLRLRDSGRGPEMEENLTPENQVNDNDEIVVRNLTKRYGNGFCALDNLSFSVKKGQTLGLLGPNGAGKSTAFNIITAALSKTQGSVQILGQSVRRGIISTNVGVCPQFNILYERLTIADHLTYFARIKGLEEHQIGTVLNYYYKILGLERYVNVAAGVLSGGNKRKLVISMAMLGNPRAIFLDEPSSGVDPISKRYLWKSFSVTTNTNNSSMILTTQSMTEAESLCSNVGILVKGKFVALSSLNRLKEKYGQGYRAIVKSPVQKHAQVKERVLEVFGKDQTKIEQISENEETLIFTIKDRKFFYTKAFKVFQEELLAQGTISEYKINESTLEEIFLLLSKLQPEVDEIVYEEPWQFFCCEFGANGCECLI